MFSRLFNEYSPTEIFEYAAEQSLIKDPHILERGNDNNGNNSRLLSAPGSMRRLSIGASSKSMRFSHASREISNAHVNKTGLVACINNFIGENTFTSSDVDEVFRAFDNDGDGLLNRKDFLSMYISYEDGGEAVHIFDDSDSEISDDLDGYSAHFEAPHANFADDTDVENSRGSNEAAQTAAERINNGTRVSIREQNPELAKSWTNFPGLAQSNSKPNGMNHSKHGDHRTVADTTKFFQPVSVNQKKDPRRASVMKANMGEDQAMCFCLNNPSVMVHWQMLYCGGSAPVVNSLNTINKTLGIDLKVEKFDW